MIAGIQTLCLAMLSLYEVIIDGVWIGNWIY
jgi:hypothetical protein